MPGRPEHDRVAGGRAEAGVRRGVVRSAVGLDLDDPADPSPARIVADERASEEGPGRRRRPGRWSASAQAARSGPSAAYGALDESGTRKPKMAKKAGMIVSHEHLADLRLAERVPEVAQERQLVAVGRR